MKSHLLLAIVLIAGLEVSSQSINLSWVKQYGGPSYITPKASAMDPSGAVITCGTLEGLSDFDPGIASNTTSSNGMKDAYIAKLNSNGEYVWSVSFGSTNDDIAYDVAVDVSGNVYCTGEFRGTVDFNPLGTTTNLTAFSGYNAFIVKYSPDGVFQWVKKFGGTSQGYESGRSITVDGSGNVISSGMFYAAVDFDPGAGISELNFSNYYASYISKLNSDGEFVWAKGFGGTYITPTEMKADENNNIFCVGYFYDNVDFNPGAGTYILDGQYYDTYIAKLDAQGNFVWAKQFTSNNYCLTNEIHIDDNGDIYAAGGFNGTTDFDPDLVNTQTVSNTTYQYRPFLVKLNSDGLFQYLKQLSPNSTGQAIGIKRDNDGNIYVAGHFYGTSDFDPDPVNEFPMSSINSYEDIFITKLDSDGDFIIAKSMGGDNYDYVSGLMMNPTTGLLMLTGNFVGTCDFDPSENSANLTSAGYTDAYIARYVQCDAITETIEASSCGSYDYNGTIYAQSGIYEHVLMSSMGCDSVVTLNLTIHSDNYSNVDLYATEAIEYNGVTYDSEGDYTQELSNQFGCDSIVYIHVDFMEVNFDIQNTEGTLGGNQAGIAYQWVDCNNNNEPISGATSSSFVPTISGSYALIVYGNDGSVISECIEVVVIGVEEQSIMMVDVFPNPCQDVLQFANGSGDFNLIEVFDQQGNLVYSTTLAGGKKSISLEGLSNGLYSIRFVGKRMAMARFIKAN
jgi:hypothetical protein